MGEPEVTTIDYASPDPKSGQNRRKFGPSWLPAVLVILVQPFWLLVLATVGAFLDLDWPAGPISCLSIFVVFFFPVIVALAIGLQHCLIEYRENGSLKRCGAAVLATVAGVGVVAFCVYMMVCA